MRLLIVGPEDLLVDLALDSGPERPCVMTSIGPSFDPEELAGRKLIALFDRAEARDFADVYVLAARFGRPVLLQRAAEIDSGFDHRVLASMIGTLSRFADNEIPADNVPALRTFFAGWATELLNCAGT